MLAYLTFWTIHEIKANVDWLLINSNETTRDKRWLAINSIYFMKSARGCPSRTPQIYRILYFWKPPLTYSETIQCYSHGTFWTCKRLTKIYELNSKFMYILSQHVTSVQVNILTIIRPIALDCFFFSPWKDMLWYSLEESRLYYFRDGWVRIGMCIPRDAEFSLLQYGGIHKLSRPSHWINASSLEELDTEDDNMGKKFYHDTVNG